MNLSIFQSPKSFQLELGGIIKNLKIAYHIYGVPNSGKKVIWVCHALTANSNVFEWWNGLFGEGKLFDPNEYIIVCANIIGSHYGTSGPLNTFEKGKALLDQFPFISTRDMARAHDLLREFLGIDYIDVLIGASLGGQQALEWSIEQADLFEKLILIATNAKHSPYGIAYNATQRLAIERDSSYGIGPEGGRNGLITARAIAMLSYRSYTGYAQTQQSKSDEVTDTFPASSYQHYQGEKLANRFNAYSYVVLSKAMDAHNVGRKRGSVIKALERIKAKTLVIGITSDQLFPVSEQQYLAENIQHSEYAEITSDFGHDGFLVEAEKLSDLIDDYLNNDFNKNKKTTLKPTKILEVL